MLGCRCVLKPGEAAGLLRGHVLVPSDGRSLKGMVALTMTKTSELAAKIQSVVAVVRVWLELDPAVRRSIDIWSSLAQCILLDIGDS
mmetsp:Transcript_13175/g.42391  ORF Transcript_13175/g.42391 Transcript_13175/m.42391 type:complete len:87 (+) Transcript_13175:172-432(+)